MYKITFDYFVQLGQSRRQLAEASSLKGVMQAVQDKLPEILKKKPTDIKITIRRVQNG